MRIRIAVAASVACLASASIAQTWFLPGEKLLDTKCLYANPTWHDVDGDGECELVVGVKRPYLKPDGTRDYYEGRALVVRNAGTPTSPSFTLPASLDDAEYLQANGEAIVQLQDASVENSQGCWGMQAAFGDVDGDGAEDFVLGGLYGEITVYRGTGTVGAYEPAEFFSSTTPPLRHVKRSHVGLWDMDGDGRDELIVGYMNGISDGTYGVGGEAGVAVYRYETGALTGGETLKDVAGKELNSPNKAFEYGGPTPAVTSRMGPSFVDVNGDGIDDLVSGSSLGGIFYYPAEATNGRGKAGSWSSEGVRLTPDLKGQHGENPDAPARSRVFATDVTGDGVPDLLVGYADGTVYLFRGTTTKGFNLPRKDYRDLVSGVKLSAQYGEIVGVTGGEKVTASGLPSGLSLKVKNGRYYVTGTPKAAIDAKTVKFKVLNAAGKTLATTKVVFAVREPIMAFALESAYELPCGKKAEIPVEMEAECAYTLKASGLPKGLSLVAKGDGTYAIEGKPTAPGEKTVKLVATYGAEAKIVSANVSVAVGNRKSEEIPLEDAYDDLIAGVKVSDFVISGAIGCTAAIPDELGLVFNAKTGKVSGTPKAPGRYLVTFTRKVLTSAPNAKPTYKTYKATAWFNVYQGYGDHTGAKGVSAPALSLDVEGLVPSETTTCSVGVKQAFPVEVEGELDGIRTDIKVKGLPDGMAFKDGQIVGAPKKKGTYTIKVSASNAYGWTSKTRKFELEVKALPAWARGMFNGAVSNEVFSGSFTLTVASSGKLSGKILTGGKTYRFSDSGFARTEEGAFLFEQTLKIADMTLPVSFWVMPGTYVTKDLAADGVARTSGRVVADEACYLAFDGAQDLWKRSDAAKFVLPVIKNGVTKTLTVTRGKLQLKFGAKGAVTISGEIDGKSVSASSTLLADSFGSAQCGCFEYGYNCRLFICIPSVDYFTAVEVTLAPGSGKKTKYDINLDCKDFCLL